MHLVISRSLGLLRNTTQVRAWHSMASPAKAQKLIPKRIGTHSGSFHCDEALGCYLLTRLDEYKDAQIVRSRDAEVLKECDVVLDVGAAYEPEKLRFDHHQKGFTEVFPGFGTKLSSAGLAYKHFGQRIIAHLMGGLPIDHPDVQTVYLATYKNFMEAIDAIDNGVNQWDGPQAPKYVNNTHLSARVGKLNPDWNEEQTGDAMDKRFAEAMALTGAEFEEAVLWLSKVWLPARAHVQAAIKGRHKVDASGEIILLPTVCPWKEHLYELEEELAIQPPIKYCIYEDTKEHKFRVQAVSVCGSFESRKPLPAEWRGLRDDQLSQKAGIDGCVFVHASGFIGGNASFDGALAMARGGLAVKS